MSWANGSRIFSDIIEALNELDIDDETRTEIYGSLIEIFENYDCDTLDECLQEDNAFDSAYLELHPPEEDENYED
jgi:hypothetical protein